MARGYESEIVVVGASSHPLRDAYHVVLRTPLSVVLAGIACTFLVANVLFACLYLATGGIANAAAGSFKDAFFFSVQTMGTIGYGAMYPQTTAANLLVVAESVVGIVLIALATGIVFARFSQSRGMVSFSDRACIAPMDGVPTLMIRVGNDRSSAIFDATVRVVLTRTEKTAEGVTFYRMYDLSLVRDRSPALMRSWTVLHRIDAASPLSGLTPDACLAQETELLVSLVGTDDTSLQPVHARVRYDAPDLIWGARPADILSELPDGRLALDVRRFHDIVPTQPTAEFPYPIDARGGAERGVSIADDS